MRCQNKVICLVHDSVHFLFRDEWVVTSLLLLELLQILDNEKAPLRFTRKTTHVCKKVRIFRVRVVVNPFAEVVGNVRCSVVVTAVFKVNQDNRIVRKGVRGSFLFRRTKVWQEDVSFLQIIVTEADR